MRHPALKDAHVLIDVKPSGPGRDCMVYVEPQDIFKPKILTVPNGAKVNIEGIYETGRISLKERRAGATVSVGDHLSFLVRCSEMKSYQFRIDGLSMTEGIVGVSKFDFSKEPS